MADEPMQGNQTEQTAPFDAQASANGLNAGAARADAAPDAADAPATIAPASWQRCALGRGISKIFGGLSMTWPKVIIFSIICGVYCGVVNQIPFLQGTSFTDIAVTWEAWVVLALVVSANCKSPLEAAFKCFVFFLISQPLVYLVEYPTLHEYPWHYLTRWMPMIIASIVAGFLSFFMRRQNAFGAIITLCAAGCILLPCCGYVNGLLVPGAFPAHLCTAIFDIAAIVFVIVLFQHGRLRRVISITLCAVGLAGAIALAALAPTGSGTYELDPADSWYISSYVGSFTTCEVVDDDTEAYLKVEVTSREGNYVTVENDAGTKAIKLAFVYDEATGEWTFLHAPGPYGDE